MAEKKNFNSGIPIRKTSELLPNVFQTDANEKFMAGVVDPLVQPGKLQKLVGYVGRRYGKTYNGNDVYLDTDQTLRSRYQLEPGVVTKFHDEVTSFHDYLDFKNQLKFFGNYNELDHLITSQEHYSWNPPINWDKFINYREYYWEPLGPPPIAITGQSSKITSTYKVSLGIDATFIFTPDGLTGNPAITLFRGQTYKFTVNAPKEGFIIRTNYDSGSLLFNPARPYTRGEFAVFDEKLWRAKNNIVPLDGSTIDLETEDWEFVENVALGTSLDYNKGVTNNGVQNGTLTFVVPYDAPDVLYYQSLINPDRFGRFIISDIESNTFIDIEKEIIGKTTYTSSNGIELSNGMILEFRGQVQPEKYSEESWLVEGVGKEITLTKFSDLIVPTLSSEVPEVLFDNEGFDTQPFDDASAFPTKKDYITISRNSEDSNPWSRYNRWFHRSILEKSYSLRGQDFPATETSRAKRPIIEFHPNIKLYNHGVSAKQTVDYVDDFTTDVFSNIEGSVGYNIDGENLFNGARVLVIADTDTLANNKIYRVEFIDHNGRDQITLRPTLDSISSNGDCVLCRRGNNNGGSMFHFDGTNWVKSQPKTKVNQEPKFDIFDENGVSFSDIETYPVSTFIGSFILSYKKSNSVSDNELGFGLSYQNIDNVGDILFEWNWDTDTFSYTIGFETYNKKIATGYYKVKQSYFNGWIKTNNEYIQPLVDTVIINQETNTVRFQSIDWLKLEQDAIFNFYLNGKKLDSTYTRNKDKFTFDTTFSEKDVLAIKIVTDLEPNFAWYELPVGLEKNPLNQALTNFTFGEAIDHIATSLEFDSRFVGNIPGVSNLRDLDEYQENSKRFLKHSGISPLAIKLLCDKNINIIKSISYANKSYRNFKENFLKKAIELPYNDNLINFVDDIIKDLTKTKSTSSPFADSDMIGTGAYTTIEYIVEDTGIKTFALSSSFSLAELSRRAVYVYLNRVQLLYKRDYDFNATFGFMNILIDIEENDEIEIREYQSTATNYIPPTPTSMGLYKKYTPVKFIDDTYVEPREVIQGHDGSITKSYGDFRDDLLLELEFRIYNNIKEEYDYDLFDIDNIIAGYYGQGLYPKKDLDLLVSQEFLKWIQNTTINYTENEFLDTENSFTYTYSNMTDPTGTINLPGYWRGVYQWFYDTDRPHRCPWEMLGFSEKPTWWEDQYGASPYTSGNLLLWEDLRDGIIRQGERAGTYDRYKRPSILDHIPVDGDGNLLSPLDSGLATNYTLINNKGPFKLGDVGPVEYSWRASSDWPFAVTLAMCLLKPFEFITDSFDRSRTELNILGQTVNKTSKIFQTLDDLVIPDTGEEQVVGLVKYIIGYVKYKGQKVSELKENLQSIDVNLSTRLSGFVDKEKQKYLLDSKNPNSSSRSIFIPEENYDVIFNVSSPVSVVTYSGVILEKTDGGWVITGYDDIQPYFNYYEPLESPNDPAISVGGVSENFVDWEPNKSFNNGSIVKYQEMFYRALRTHTSENNFDINQWKKLPNLPLVGSVVALRRKEFNRLKIKQLSYGTKLTSIQQVVDLLLGYEEYLKSLGFVFDRYEPSIGESQNWLTSCKEFMFWTRQNWAIGSLISLSPGAQSLKIDGPIGVADNILDGFYDYQLLKDDGKPLAPKFINIKRQFQSIVIDTTDTTEGIYFLKLYYVLKEHVTVFDDKTVFNDIIYDKTTGYRQERIKTQGYRTVDWDGDYTSPGFIFDNVNIEIWKPFVDYKLGDIVSYRSYNWTSLSNQIGTENFDITQWTKLDSEPEKRLVPNFDYRINQFEDYYDVSSEGISETERKLARHAIGYQSRTYLENLAEDPITQFQLYQGFIREKGTANAITKVFNKLSRAGSESVELKEEWAFQVGRFGGIDQLREIEFTIEKDKFLINPQPLLITISKPNSVVDQYYYITEDNFTVKPIPFSTEINPKSFDTVPVRTAGFVNVDDVEFTVATKDDILNLNIFDFNENDHVWITFDNSFSWTVLRFNRSDSLNITSVFKDQSQVVITLSRNHNIEVDDIVGVTRVLNLSGFYKVIAKTQTTITVSVDPSIENPEIDESTFVPIYLFTDAKYPSYQTIDQNETALLFYGSKLWIENNGSNLWEVIEKKQQYISNKITDYGISSPVNTGTKVLYDDVHKFMITSIPASGFATTYIESSTGLSLKQIIIPPSDFRLNATGSFGEEMALSPDSRFLVIASPRASGIRNFFQGDFDITANYTQEDIVLYAGKLWRAKRNINGDGSSIDLSTEDWEPASLVEATVASGTTPGFTYQGFISIYEYINQEWRHSKSIVSPRQADNEYFGSKVTVSQNGNDYYMAVSAPGSLDDRGRVYLYKYDGTSWKHLQNNNYAGIYDPTGATFYPQGSIVWFNGSLWQSLEDKYGDGSTIDIFSNDWIRIDAISTQNSLPTNHYIDDDGSTLALGMLDDNQITELTKPGDQFGKSMTMNRDGSILVIGAPYADGQYFARYKGLWRNDYEYIEGDVVKYQDPTIPDYDPQDETKYSYYQLVDTSLGPDSTFRSYNEEPSDTSIWQNVGDSTSDPSGKVYIYQKNDREIYVLKQTITADTLTDINDIINSSETIASGDQFGFALDIDYSGTSLVITSPNADKNFQNQGSAYIFRTDGFAEIQYRLKQKIESYELYPNEYFGQSVSITPGAEKLVVGAKNTPFINQTKLDDGEGTEFDQGNTRFIYTQGFAGSVYVYEKKDNLYFLTDKLQSDLSDLESFGYSVDCTYSVIAVGSPDYRVPVYETPISYGNTKIGIARLFKKQENAESWKLLSQQQPTIDINQIKSIALYDEINNVKIQDLDFVDHSKLKILNIAEQEISYKTGIDPAYYNVGTEEQNVISDLAWAEKNVGKLWWNLRTVKWIDYEQDDLVYKLGRWNQQALGSSIGIYEWVESPLLPSEWAALADTNEGLAEGISGQPLYPNDDVYTVKFLFNPTTGLPTETLYYYWVGNSVVTPEAVGRRLSAASVRNLINNPIGTGLPHIALIDGDKFIAYNFDSILNVDLATINIQYKKDKSNLNQIHNEYQLLTEGVADSLPSTKLEEKWIDSLAGRDLAGNRVPDPSLPVKQRYGIKFRPRQTMFVNREEALKGVVNNINLVLKTQPFSDIINFSTLNLKDEIPSILLNLYDETVETIIDLETVGTTRVKQAILQTNIVDGEIDTIDIIDPGFGYKVAPPVEFEGDGTGAKAVVTIDNQGRITTVTVSRRGKKYSTCIAKVRRFSVLVTSDNTANNFWSVYAWDDIRKVFFRSRSQAFETTRYWGYTDWWEEGYGITSRIVKEIRLVSNEPTLNDIEEGDLIKIKEYGSGGWAVFEKTETNANNFLEDYKLVGRENGTIQLNENLYNTELVGIGYDNAQSFDAVRYDLENSLELRNILKAIKEEVFINDYNTEWNKLFFSSIKYIFAEQQYVDWAFKTSFLNAIHNIGDLEQKVNYKNDNLENFQDYINEVKPYHTTVREYVSRYTNIDNTNSVLSDFDLPPVFSTVDGQIIPVTSRNSSILSEYPWKYWNDNKGYSVVSIEVSNVGADYTQSPRVVIEGDGQGATATAYVSNGTVSSILVTNPGSGYSKAPSITLVGGNPSSSAVAKAVAIIGNTKARTFNLGVKFDRITKQGIYSNFTQTEQLVASGFSSVFDLKYATTRDKSKISLKLNGQIVLPDDYTITLYRSEIDTYKLLKGKIIFNTVPLIGDIIDIVYEKNDELLDAVNRINKYYDPVSGMKGDDLSQLMTGIDFGGVQIQGNTFDVTGGWDALPWFTDNWDSVEPTSDYYVRVDGSTTEVALPYIPADGQEINIYIKRANSQKAIRIDDPNYDENWDSAVATNPNAEMPTFYGDGSTKIIPIGIYIQTEADDTLIFRPSDSDGSVTINDENILDTAISGGSLSAISNAYVTATGRNAEDISIDGDAFITPDQVPAPEENIPGQVLDSLSIKVFNSTISGAAPLQSRTLVSNGVTTTFDIGLDVLEQNSVIVYVNKIKKEIGIGINDYSIDLKNKQITFVTPPTSNSVIEIISIGIGGVALLDYQEYTGDGDTTLFLTAANYVDTGDIFVTVDGNQSFPGFANSSDLVDVKNKTIVQFGVAPVVGSTIKIIALGSTTDVDLTGLSIVRINQQELTFDGSTRTLSLDNFVNLQRASAESALVVEVNDRALQGPDTEYFEYDGVTRDFTLGIDPSEPAGAILLSNIIVLINNERKIPVQDFVYNGTTKILSIVSNLQEGDIIKIENNLRSEYTVSGNNLILDPLLAITENDRIHVTWFSEYPSMQIMADEFVGGKVNYQLKQVPLNVNYVWVYKNGSKLTKDEDYYVSLPRSVLYLKNTTTSSDEIKILMFSADIYKLPSAYEIHKDMLNIYRYKRYSKGRVVLTKELKYYDKTVEVSNASLLSDPIPTRNIPGVIEVNNERIEYMAKSGNVLSQLRRGSLGTSIGESYPLGSDVIDLGAQETIPYNEKQFREDFVSDGSTLLIGPLDYVPAKSNRGTWYRDTIPTTHGACDIIEVFSGGARLRKDPINVYDETLGASSPTADRQIEAEFSVDGSSAYVRLTNPVPAGTRISIIKRTGNAWYNRGETTASNGVTLLANSTAIAEFIADRTTDLPE